MSNPEISRRCRSCGASIRAHGLFCPQCGKPTPAQSDHVEEQAIETEEVFDASETLSVDLSRLPTTDLTSAHPASSAPTVPLQPFSNAGDQTTALDERPTTTLGSTAPPTTTQAEVGSRVQQVRELGGEVKKGFGKVREISSVMLEEASYDPSARFVLVAAVIFVLFLIILILSEMMR